MNRFIPIRYPLYYFTTLCKKLIINYTKIDYMINQIVYFLNCYIKNLSKNTNPKITVVKLISFLFPVNNFNIMYDITPNTIPSDIE